MTPQDITHDIKLLADQAVTSGDQEDGPGLILISSATWCRQGFVLATVHPTAAGGIRHRGLRVWISSKFEDRVLSRREARALGSEDFHDLLPAQTTP